jgi:hypothetical protein
VRWTGCPAWTHASIPPRSGRIFWNPARFRCLAATAADSSFGHAQVHDDLQFAGIGRYDRVDVLRMCGNGAWNGSFLRPNLLRPHIKNKKLLAFVDQPTQFVDGDTVHAKLTDKRLPPPPSCQQIQAKGGEDSYFPAQNWMTLPFAQNRLGCGKLQGRTDSGLTFVGSADSFL